MKRDPEFTDDLNRAWQRWKDGTGNLSAWVLIFVGFMLCAFYFDWDLGWNPVEKWGLAILALIAVCGLPFAAWNAWKNKKREIEDYNRERHKKTVTWASDPNRKAKRKRKNDLPH